MEENQVLEVKLCNVDILINNAGVQKRNPSMEFPHDDWDFVMNVNAKAVFFLCQSVEKIMIKQGKKSWICNKRMVNGTYGRRICS